MDTSLLWGVSSRESESRYSKNIYNPQSLVGDWTNNTLNGVAVGLDGDFLHLCLGSKNKRALLSRYVFVCGRLVLIYEEKRKLG
jgi:hypothetical protein